MIILDDNMLIEDQKISKIKNRSTDFHHIIYNNLNLKNSLLKEIDKETKNLEKYFFEKIAEFPKIFPEIFHL